MSARLATLTSIDSALNNDAPRWSHRVAERFCCRVEPTLADWLDREVWKESGAGEFHYAVSPDSLLAEHSDVIWPGMMLPDTLPLVGNRYGDWLCMRVGGDNTVSEIVHWYHGGGDWIPWGRTLAEAIVFDSIRDTLPGRRQKHAVDAEERRVSRDENPYLSWALRFVPEQALAADHVALRCEWALNALDSQLRERMTPEIASGLSIAWEPEVVSWLFDCQLVPNGLRNAVANACDFKLLPVQAWDEAQKHAVKIASMRDDLVWVFDIAGWAEEREGRFAEAAALYQRGCMALAFADQSIRFRTHWFPQWAGKFSTWRLTELINSGKISQASVSRPVAEYLSEIQTTSGDSLRVRAMRYWRKMAELAVKEGRWADAYNAFYRAGWDLGADTMIDFGDLLKGLAESAKRAGQTARAAVAEFHYDAFVTRFG